MNLLSRARRRYLLRAGLGLLWLAFLMGHALELYRLDWIERLEVRTYDLRLLATAAGVPDSDPDVVVIDIDEASLGEIGRWPWPRHVMAALVEELVDRQRVALVAFDVVFAEPDESGGLPVLEELARGRLRDAPGFEAAVEDLRPELDRDARFARTLEERPVLLGYYFTGGDQALRSGQLPAPALLAEDFGGRRLPLIRADGYGANLPILQQAARGAGHFTPFFDPDGLSRRVPLLIEFGGDYYESLSLAAARQFLGGVPLQPVVGTADGGGYLALEVLRVGDRIIPVDHRGNALIPYRGPERSFPYISAADLVSGRLAPGSLENRIALVGTSAPGLMDLRATPVGSAYPGVEIHANLISGIIDEGIRHRPAYLAGFELLALVALGGLLAMLLPVLGPASALAAAAVAMAGVVALGMTLWSSFLLVMPMALLLSAVAGVYALDTVFALFVESRAKARVSALFGQYVPPRVVEALAENPELASMEGESRDMSVLFSDVRDFTTISEGLSAQALSALMNDYLSKMTRAIQAHDGTVDKYIGDAIMAFWGAPLPRPDHALGAVRTALAMQEAARGLREDYARRGWPALHVGIGVNSGVMNVGNMGSEFRRAYTVLGDAVNLASRLEALTKQYGVGVLVSESTRAATEDRVHYRELDRIQVKGKAKAVSIHEPLMSRDGPTTAMPAELRERCGLYAEMLGAYRTQDWDGAERALGGLSARGESAALLSLFRSRITAFRAAPPGSDWDGVFRFETK
jgi:adenylate cyclase